MLTAQQIRAVRWYTGDVEGADPFWSDPKAYLVVNSLFFPEIGTERMRAAEGKHLNPAILADEERLYGTLSALLSAFSPSREMLHTCRVERMADFEAMRQAGGTLSFTSTSTAGFLPAYADRRGIALMRFALPEGTPCIRMAEALPRYAKAGEAEVLLPPGLALRFTEQTIPLELLHITDADGNQPQILVDAAPGERLPKVTADAPTGGNIAGMRVLAALNCGTEPDPAEVRIYAQWKKSFTGGLLSF